MITFNHFSVHMFTELYRQPSWNTIHSALYSLSRLVWRRHCSSEQM